ncbi:MAG TPA: hypothetical protein VNY29_07525 [Terriglobales bacterium]|nr:hypothetical protein [Terriglobales bacterium]
MRYDTRLLTIAVFLTLYPVKSRCDSPPNIPGPNQGYEITHNDSSQKAPDGYEGHTDTSIQTAVGNTPATKGKKFVTSFKLENQIKTCPTVDGVSEGTGVFSMVMDYTDEQATGTSFLHIEMTTSGKYKGQVGDNGLLEGPVNGEFDYSFKQSGWFGDPHGAKANTSPSNVQQHVNMPIIVGRLGQMPSFGPFDGGDPTKGHYSDAVLASMALGYWAGVYYAVAQTKWYGGDTDAGRGGEALRSGVCAEIVFDPPSYTVQPPLGTQIEVKAMLRTRRGEEVPGRFLGGVAFTGGSISPSSGQSGIGSPTSFTYTAPNGKTAHAGFSTAALSRAGTAVAEWLTGLGTGWSGQISYVKQYTGDQGHNDLQSWSNSLGETITINVKDGVAEFNGSFEEEHVSENRHAVATGGGKVTLQPESSDTSRGYAQANVPATVNVNINEARKTYDIQVGVSGSTQSTGKTHSTRCFLGKCTSTDQDIGMLSLPSLDPMGGTLQDPNRIQASRTIHHDNLGRAHNGAMVETMIVNLARSGTTKRSGAAK